MDVCERLWRDKMDIYRWVETTVNEVTTNTEQLQLPSGIKCHYSKGSLTDTGTDGIPTLVNSYSLFCSLKTDLREGDKIAVTQRNGKTINLAVGEGFPYSSHQEFSVKRSDTA